MPVDPKRKDAVDKTRRKIADRIAAAKKRARRLERRSSEQRAEHDRWQRSHTPGDPAKRAAERMRREHSQAVAELLARPPAPATPSAELAALNRAIVALRAQLEPAQPAPMDKVQFTGGVFD